MYRLPELQVVGRVAVIGILEQRGQKGPLNGDGPIHFRVEAAVAPDEVGEKLSDIFL